SRLDIFLAEAKRKEFPLEYTWMDCALRGYGAFVLWMHLLVYLIFKYIHRDIDDGKGDNLSKERPLTPGRASFSSRRTSARKVKVSKNRSSQSQSAKDSAKSGRRKNPFRWKQMRRKGTFSESTDEEKGDTIDYVGTQKSERVPVDVIWEQRRKLMKEFLDGYKKELAAESKSAEIIPPGWATSFDIGKEDTSDKKFRLNIRDWLLKQGTAEAYASRELMASKEKIGSKEKASGQEISKETPKKSKETTKDTSQSVEQGYSVKNTLPSRAPHGHQLDTLTTMDRFLEKFGSGEGISSDERLSAEALREEQKTQSVKDGGLAIAPTPRSEHRSHRSLHHKIVSMQEPFVATPSKGESTAAVKEVKAAALPSLQKSSKRKAETTKTSS
ncbi:hypothetical protein V3C99_010303, partial [Haemonchus contortus]